MWLKGQIQHPQERYHVWESLQAWSSKRFKPNHSSPVAPAGRFPPEKSFWCITFWEDYLPEPVFSSLPTRRPAGGMVNGLPSKERRTMSMVKTLLHVAGGACFTASQLRVFSFVFSSNFSEGFEIFKNMEIIFFSDLCFLCLGNCVCASVWWNTHDITFTVSNLVRSWCAAISSTWFWSLLRHHVFIIEEIGWGV